MVQRRRNVACLILVTGCAPTAVVSNDTPQAEVSQGTEAAPEPAADEPPQDAPLADARNPCAGPVFRFSGGNGPSLAEAVGTVDSVALARIDFADVDCSSVGHHHYVLSRVTHTGVRFDRAHGRGEIGGGPRVPPDGAILIGVRNVAPRRLSAQCISSNVQIDAIADFFVPFASEEHALAALELVRNESCGRLSEAGRSCQGCRPCAEGPCCLLTAGGCPGSGDLPRTCSHAIPCAAECCPDTP
jgi:hypothetical protein